jgi:uncharacterized protein with PIN domain
MKRIFLRFYAELNDFLQPEKRQVQFSFEYMLDTSIKDLIESLGVPHPEIDLILVNGKSAGFEYIIKNGDVISVYPVFESFDITEVIKLREFPLREPKFIIDIQLGKLANFLRLLGFDSLYNNVTTNDEIIKLSLEQKRTILTKSIHILKNKTVARGYWLRSYNPREQIIEVLRRFDLKDNINPFSRCIICNTELAPADKTKILEMLPPKVIELYNDFLFCPQCKKAYWKGTHYEKMLIFINSLLFEI